MGSDGSASSSLHSVDAIDLAAEVLVLIFKLAQFSWVPAQIRLLSKQARSESCENAVFFDFFDPEATVRAVLVAVSPLRKASSAELRVDSLVSLPCVGMALE